MSKENVEIVRSGIAAWNRRDADLWLTYAAPEIEWVPAGPAAVEQANYGGYDEVARGLAAVWDTWEVFDFAESEVRDLDSSVLWLGHVKMRGATTGGASESITDPRRALNSCRLLPGPFPMSTPRRRGRR